MPCVRLLSMALRRGVVLLLLSPGAWADGPTQASIDDRRREERRACEPLQGNAREVCREAARSRARVAQLERLLRERGDPADACKLHLVRAETDFGVSRQRCDDQQGSGRLLCIQRAKSVELQALAEARRECASLLNSSPLADLRPLPKPVLMPAHRHPNETGAAGGARPGSASAPPPR